MLELAPSQGLWATLSVALIFYSMVPDVVGDWQFELTVEDNHGALSLPAGTVATAGIQAGK